MTAEQKFKLYNKLVKFVERGMPKSMFNHPLYNELNGMFYHIAEYNRENFYDIWFSTPAKRWKWIEYVTSHTPVGDPAWTKVDVEREFKSWLFRHTDLVNKFRDEAEAAIQEEDLNLAQQLAARYPNKVKVNDA